MNDETKSRDETESHTSPNEKKPPRQPSGSSGATHDPEPEDADEGKAPEDISAAQIA